MASSPRDVGVVIAAGGRGERAGTAVPKQFREIAGVPMLLRAIRPFAAHPRVADIVVPLPAEVVENPPDWLGKLAGERLRTVAGGDTRAESVSLGVAALSRDCTAVVVHDAARPFVSPDTINAIIELVTQGTCAIAAVPVSDTIKRSDADGERVLETVRRDGLWRAQTPQGFPRQALEQAYAHQELSVTATDEAALVEAVGIPVALVRDTTTNMKVTAPEDFVVAEALASQP
jgi:2-C-methyl-D-erythritol 4-phosphate cytidylyltransferase